MKRWCFLIGLAVFVLSALPAATVSFLVVEAGLPAETAVPNSSRLWENGMLDAFFEAGHIVSNAPILRVEGKSFPELKAEIKEAREGGADFLVVAFLSYREGVPEKPSATIRLFSVSSGSLLYETSFRDEAAQNSDEEFLTIKNNAKQLVPELRRKR